MPLAAFVVAILAVLLAALGGLVLGAVVTRRLYLGKTPLPPLREIGPAVVGRPADDEDDAGPAAKGEPPVREKL